MVDLEPSEHAGPYRTGPAAAETVGSAPPLLVCEGVSHSYDGLRHAVDSLSFSIQTGRVLALIGPNGAGKTTLLRMLAGLLPPSTGSIVLDGVDVVANAEDARALVGYLPDDFALYESLTAMAQLRFFAELHEIDRAVAEARIEELLVEFDLWSHRERPIGGFSRGMKQRLGLAKTLLHDPKLVLLDEPASALDPGSRDRLRESLLRLKQSGRTIVVSSHILPDLAGLADSVVILERGRVVHTGAIDEQRITDQESISYDVRVFVSDPARAVFESFGPRLTEVEELAPGQFRIVLDGGAHAASDLIVRLVEAGAELYRIAPSESAIEVVFRRSAAERAA